MAERIYRYKEEPERISTRSVIQHRLSSIEALAQASSPDHAFETDSGWVWMPSAHRLKKDPDPKGLPFSWRAYQANNANTDASLLEKLFDDASFYVRHAVANNPATPQDLRDERLVASRQEIASRANTPIDELEEMAHDRDWDVRKGVVSHHNVPVHVLERLAKEDKDSNVLYYLAKNPRTPVDALRQIAKTPASSGYTARKGVAENQNSPADVLMTLSLDNSREVRGAVAENPNTPPDVLRLMVNDRQWQVQESLAKNPSTPIDILRNLSKLAAVRYGLAVNPSTPIDILEAMSTDKEDSSRIIAAKNPSTPPSTLARMVDDSSVILSWAIRNPNMPAEALRKIAQKTYKSESETRDTRDGLARSKNVPDDVLEALTRDEMQHVRYAVAENPRLTDAQLRRLAKDPDVLVHRGVAKNPSAPVDVLRKLASSADMYVRMNVAAHLDTPADVVGELAMDKQSLVSYNARMNPNWQPKEPRRSNPEKLGSTYLWVLGPNGADLEGAFDFEEAYRRLREHLSLGHEAMMSTEVISRQKATARLRDAAEQKRIGEERSGKGGVLTSKYFRCAKKSPAHIESVYQFLGAEDMRKDELTQMVWSNSKLVKIDPTDELFTLQQYVSPTAIEKKRGKVPEETSVFLAADKSGRRWIVDGHHTLAAAKEDGRPIDAILLSYEDAKWAIHEIEEMFEENE